MSVYSRSYNPQIFEDTNSSLFKIVSQIDSRSRDILDVGCSSGYLGRYLKGKFPQIRIDGIEINRSDRLQAQKYLDHVYPLDIQDTSQLSQITQKYDTIIFADVLEHTANPHQVLKQFVACLKPRGKIIFSLPNVVHQSIILELLHGQWNYEKSGLLDRTHLHLFDHREVVNLIESNHLYLTQVDHTIFDLPRQRIEDILNQRDINQPSLVELLKQPPFPIFQYIVTATNSRPASYTSYLSNTTILTPVSDWINDWEPILHHYHQLQSELKNNSPPTHQLKQKNQKIRQLKQQISQLKKQHSQLDQTYTRLIDSKYYRLYPLYEKVKSVLKSIISKL